MTVNADSSGTVVVSYTPTATDAVGPTPTITCVPASGSTFAVGTTTVTCTAKDAAGNISAPSSFTVTVRDVTPPVFGSASVSPSLLWPPNGAIVPVTVTVNATDSGTGVVRFAWAVIDEYGTYQPTGTVTVAGNGPFSFQVPLLADRRGNDKDGRHYTIKITAFDGAGNGVLLATPLVVNVHDQGGF
jgi:hypothetical protein